MVIKGVKHTYIWKININNKININIMSNLVFSVSYGPKSQLYRSSELEKYTNMTLDVWQNTHKPLNEIIVQSSNPTGNDKSEFFKFPIGMQHNYSKMNSTDQNSMQVGTHDNLVLCAMSLITDRRRRGNQQKNRQIIMNNLQENDISNCSIPSHEFYKSLSNYKFVISPEGNGIDCHRHYEALLAGCIPIVEYNVHMERKYRNLPILYTNDYSEITESYLMKKYHEFKTKKYDFSNLFISTYSKENQQLIKQFGNLWCLRTNGKPHYV